MAKLLKLERLYQLKSGVCASILCSAADRRLICNDSLVISKLTSTFRVGDHVRLMEVCEARWTATRGCDGNTGAGVQCHATRAFVLTSK